MTSLSIGLLLYDVLSKNEGLSGIPIYPVLSPGEETLPYIIYRRTSTSDSAVKSNVRETVSFEVDCYADKYESAVNLAEKARAAFSIGNFVYNDGEETLHAEMIQLIDASEDYNSEAYFITLRFSAKVW